MRLPPGQEPAPILTKAPPCGSPISATPPTAVVQLVAASESCARLADKSTWCWGGRSQILTASHETSPLACPVATKIDELGGADALWAGYRTTCATVKGAARCGVITDWGFVDESKMDVTSSFFWNGLPCGIARDKRIRCYADQRKTELGLFGPADQAVTMGPELCVLSKTAVGCLRDGNVVVLASGITQIAAGDNLWGLRSDGTVVRLDACPTTGCKDAVVDMRDATEIASGGTMVCAVERDGHVACATTGAANRVDGIDDATQIAVGSGHACALRKTGEVVCWGASGCGQAGGPVEAGKVCKPTVVPLTTIQWAR